VGELSAIRSVLVSDRTLAGLASSYGLERYLLLAPSAACDPRGEESRLADAFEALLAALYLSTQSFSLIWPWLTPHFQRLAREIRTDPAYQNYKAALQAWTQAHYRMLPDYRVRETGQRQASDRFTAEVSLQGQPLGKGTGRSIKAAEKAAAQAAFLKLQADASSDQGTMGL
jgi:ribonuclease-3